MRLANPMLAMVVLVLASGCAPEHSREGGAEHVAGAVSVTPEETFYLEGGWGYLKLGSMNEAGRRSINIKTESDGYECTVKGDVSRDFGSVAVLPISAASKCEIAMTRTPVGVEVVAGSDGCSDLCGYNGSFEGLYLAVDPICTFESIETITQQLQTDGGGSEKALANAEQALQVCKRTMTYYMSAKLRVEAASALARAGDRKGCALMLSQYAEDISKTEDELSDGKTANAAGETLDVMDLVRPVLARCQVVE